MHQDTAEISAAELASARAVISRQGRQLTSFHIVARRAPRWPLHPTCPETSHIEVSVTYPGVRRAIYRARPAGNWVADFERDLVAGRFDRRVGSSPS